MKKPRKNLDVTDEDIADVLAEIEKVRPRGHHKTQVFTPAQDKVLLLARNCEQHRQVPWPKLVAIWRAKWGGIAERTLRARYLELQKQRNSR